MTLPYPTLLSTARWAMSCSLSLIAASTCAGELPRISLPSVEDLGPESALGRSVAAFEGGVLVGAPFATVDGKAMHGRVTSFRRLANGSYEYSGDIESPRTTANACFGLSIAIDGDLALLGSPGCTDPDDPKASQPPGLAELFRHVDNGWVKEAEFRIPAHAAPDSFGFSLALDSTGGRVAAGTFADVDGNGAVYVFDRIDSGAWTLAARIARPAENVFGLSVGISGDQVLVGAPFHGNFGTVFVYQRTGSQGYALAQALTPKRARTPTEWAGWSIAVTQDHAAIGAPYSMFSASSEEGTVDLYELSNNVWEFTEHLVSPPSYGTNGARFGWSVSLSASEILVGAPGTRLPGSAEGVMQGAVHAFASRNQPQAEYLGSYLGDQPFAEFGNAVSTRGPIAVAGAFRASSQTTLAGDGMAFALEAADRIFGDNFDLAHPLHPYAPMEMRSHSARSFLQARSGD